jgi:hypothetical protein
MIEQVFGYYVAIFLIIVSLLVASTSIPFIGFIHKRWKGFAIGCLLQPVFCAVTTLAALLAIYFYEQYDLRNHREAAMVTVKQAIPGGDVETWYLKPDDECYYEYWEAGEKSVGYDDSRLFDVFPLDSNSVGVDDRLVVKFDLNTHQVTATDYGKPLEVVKVDWDRVREYFSRLKQ